MINGYDLLGVVSPSMLAVAKSEELGMPVAASLAPGLAAGLAGMALWGQHRVLGFIAGDSLGMNAYRLYRGQGKDRTLGGCNIAVAASTVVGSLLAKDHPFLGGCAGFIAGVAVTAFVPGSNASKLRDKLR